MASVLEDLLDDINDDAEIAKAKKTHIDDEDEAEDEEIDPDDDPDDDDGDEDGDEDDEDEEKSMADYDSGDSDFVDEDTDDVAKARRKKKKGRKGRRLAPEFLGDIETQSDEGLSPEIAGKSLYEDISEGEEAEVLDVAPFLSEFARTVSKSIDNLASHIAGIDTRLAKAVKREHKLLKSLADAEDADGRRPVGTPMRKAASVSGDGGGVLFKSDEGVEMSPTQIRQRLVQKATQAEDNEDIQKAQQLYQAVTLIEGNPNVVGEPQMQSLINEALSK